MRFVDVNVLVYSHRPESPDHERCQSWLDEARTADETLGLADVVLSGFVRIVTHPKIFRQPTPTSVALDFIRLLREAPAAQRVAPGTRTWPIFERLVAATGATGNLIPDAYLAAMTIESGASLVSADRNFARFTGLRWLHPLDG